MRFDAGGGVWRVAFAFDPKRAAILPAAGDKSGRSERPSDKRLIEKADGARDAEAKAERQAAMARTLGAVIAGLPAEERAKIEARAAALIKEEMSLQDLRKAMRKTQIRVARKMKVGQDSVSRVEKRADMLISTLRGYVRPWAASSIWWPRSRTGPPVRLKQLGEIAAKPQPRKKREKRALA